MPEKTKGTAIMILNAVGDIALSRKVAEIAAQKGWLFPFRLAEEILKQADIVFGVLPGPLSLRGAPNSNKLRGSPHFRIDPAAVKGVKYAGFNVLCLANNHILDYGKEAFFDTLEILNGYGIKYLGVGRNEKEARNPLVIQKDGLKIAFLAYTYTYPATKNSPGCALIKEKNIREDILKIKDLVDVVIVSLHHGLEYSDYPLPAHISLAHKIIDWGAHLILGHHSHVLQGIEYYKHGVIAYSLGNFVIDLSDLEIRRKALNNCLLAKTGKVSFDPETDTRPMESIIFQCKLTKKGIDGLKLIPIYINENYQPVIPDDKKSQAILGRITGLSSDLKNKDLPIWQTVTEAYSQEYINAAINEGWLQNLKRIHKIRPSHFSLLGHYLCSRFNLR